MGNVAMIIKSTAAPGKRDELFELYREHLAPRAEALPLLAGEPEVIMAEPRWSTGL